MSSSVFTLVDFIYQQCCNIDCKVKIEVILHAEAFLTLLSSFMNQETKAFHIRCKTDSAASFILATLTGLICFAEILESNIFPVRVVSFGMLLFFSCCFYGSFFSSDFLLLSVVWSVLLLTASGLSLRAVGG